MNFDFTTTRGPAQMNDANTAIVTTAGIRYTLTGEFHEHYGSDGSPRAFTQTCRINASDKDAFLKSILADVRVGAADPSKQINLALFNRTDKRPMSPLFRFSPQQHPIHPAAWAVEAEVLSGQGYPTRTGSTLGWLDRAPRPATPTDDGSPLDGKILVNVMWRDLPYTVEVSGEVLANASFSEISRYCQFRSAPKGSHQQIQGNSLFFVDDAGALIQQGTTDITPIGNPLFTVSGPNTAQVIYLPSNAFTIIWRMVPRVPTAADLMRGSVNQFKFRGDGGLALPTEISPTQPAVGTMLYLNYEVSDPYYTVSGQRVYDITYHFLYRPSGTGPYRGHNGFFCSKFNVFDFQRAVFGRDVGTIVAGKRQLVKRDGTTLLTLPKTGVAPDDTDTPTEVGYTPYPFAIHENLFRLDGSTT